MLCSSLAVFPDSPAIDVDLGALFSVDLALVWCLGAEKEFLHATTGLEQGGKVSEYCTQALLVMWKGLMEKKGLKEAEDTDVKKKEGVHKSGSSEGLDGDQDDDQINQELEKTRMQKYMEIKVKHVPDSFKKGFQSMFLHKKYSLGSWVSKKERG